MTNTKLVKTPQIQAIKRDSVPQKMMPAEHAIEGLVQDGITYLCDITLCAGDGYYAHLYVAPSPDDTEVAHTIIDYAESMRDVLATKNWPLLASAIPGARIDDKNLYITFTAADDYFSAAYANHTSVISFPFADGMDDLLNMIVSVQILQPEE